MYGPMHHAAVSAYRDVRNHAAVSGSTTEPGERPFLRVVRGLPSDEELAALVALLSRPAPASPPRTDPAPSGWADRGRAIGAPRRPGPGAWQASARP